MSIKKTGQEGLLLWLQSRTHGYNGVNITDFTRSWENGLGFCALIHSFYPDKIPYDTLKPEDKAANLKLAFDTAGELGVPALMDPEDMLMDCGPDKFSVITYVSQYFHKFKDFDNKGSDEVQIKAPQPAMSKEDEMWLKRQKLEQERMLSKKCAKCTQGFPNGGTIIDALGKQYHPDCFVCFSCAKAFKDNKFVNVDGNPYCPQCAKDKFTSKTIAPPEEENPPCFKCKKLCEGDTVNALGHSWHPECFTCTTCNKLFQAGVAKVLNVDGFPYCEQCGRRAFVSRRTVASPTPPGGGLNKSKSMGSIPKMMEMASDSPSAKPLLGIGTGSLGVGARLQAFQKPPEEPAPKKEPGRLGSGSGIFGGSGSGIFGQKKQDEDRKKKEEEEAKKKKEEEEAKRKKEEEEDAKRKKEEEEAKRKEKEEEELEIKRKKDEQDKESKKNRDDEDKETRKRREEEEKEEARRKKEDEKQRKKQEEEEKKRKEHEEKEARKREEEEAKKRRADEVKRRKLEEEEKKKKEAEEEEAKKREKQDQIKRARSESNAKKLEMEEIKRKAEEEKKKKEMEEDERKKEALRKKREEMKNKAAEEEKKKEESTNKRSSIRFLQRSVTETFVAHNKIADISSSTTTTVLTASNTPRDSGTPRGGSDTQTSSASAGASTPRDAAPATTPSSTQTVHTLLTPRASPSNSNITPPITLTPPTSPSPTTSRSPSPSPPSTSSPTVSTLQQSPPLGSITTATEKVIKLQVPNKFGCPAADVLCPWTAPAGGGESAVQAHTSSCPFYVLRPILFKLMQSNEDLLKKVEQLQADHEKDHDTIVSLQRNLFLK